VNEILRVSVNLNPVTPFFRMKVCVVIKGDDPLKGQYNTQQVYANYTFNGNNYMMLTPHPYLMIDISKKGGDYSRNNSFNLNGKDLFFMIDKVESLLEKFKDKALYYYDEQNELKVDSNRALKYRVYLTCGTKMVCITPAVIRSLDNDNVEKSYEGVILYINSVEYFTQLTYGELRYFLYELKNVNLTQSGLELMNFYMFTSLAKTMGKENIMKPASYEHMVIEEIPDMKKEELKPEVHIEDTKNIPNI
jgi:hypothetical protein